MATINDIAKMADVSTSTVSHVVNKTRYVSPEKVERVERAIKELDYLPNFVLKKTTQKVSPVTGKYILLIVSDKRSEFQRQIARQIEVQLKNTGLSLITIDCESDISSMEVFFKSLLELSTISGIIVFPDENDILIKQILMECRLPMVILGREVKNFMADTICSDTFEGAYKAIRHLVSNGHEHIAYLGSNKERSPMRLDGYKKALQDFGVEYNSKYVFPFVQEAQEVFDTLDQLLMGEVMPTALLVANNSLIISFLKYIEAHNIVCPDDLSVVCFSNFEWAPLHTPAITTVEQDVEEYGRLAVYTLLQRIQNSEAANLTSLKNVYQTKYLPAKINVRSSTCGIGRGPFGEKASSAAELILSEEEIRELRRLKLTAAISFHYAGKAWMKLHEKGIKEIFDNLGISLIATTDAHFDPELQCKQLESLSILEPDIIIAIPTDNEKTAGAFKKLAQVETKLILITNVPAGFTPSDYVTCVSVNEHSHGQNMGHGLGEYMQKHNLTNYGMIVHSANFYATNQRDNAARQVLGEEYTNLHFCSELKFDKENQVYKKTCELMKRYPEIEGLYISWDGPAMEAIAALTDIGRSDVVIVTGDLDHADAMNMARGGMIKMLSAQCPYEQGQAIALAAANSVLKKKVPSFIGIEPVSVTAGNLLKSWKKIFKEEASSELKQAFKENPNYVSTQKY